MKEAWQEIDNAVVQLDKQGIKYDTEKPRWDLLPMDIIEEVVKVITFGAKKYQPNDWKSVRPKERYMAAALRHIAKHQNGITLDEETGLSHLSHALCSLVFYMWIERNEK